MSQLSVGPAKDGSKVFSATKVAITPKGKKPLTKTQREFNKLTKKVESLRQELYTCYHRLEEHLDYYTENIRPLEIEFAAANRTMINLLIPFILDKKKLTKNEKGAIKQFASNLLEEVLALSEDEPDDELKKIFELLNDMNFDQMQYEALEEMKAGWAEKFEELGMKPDFSGFKVGLRPEEIEAITRELEDKLFDEVEAMEKAEAQKKKTKKQLELERLELELEAAKQKSIDTICAPLLPVLNPESEADPEMKSRKENVIAQLTASRENGDIHTLLRLEIEWAGKKEKKIDSLSDEKLSIYNVLLEEQIEDMEETFEDMCDDPCFMPLLRFSTIEELLESESLENKMEQLEMLLATRNDSIEVELSTGPSALRFVKQLAQDQMSINRSREELDDLFSDFVEI